MPPTPPNGERRSCKGRGSTPNFRWREGRVGIKEPMAVSLAFSPRKCGPPRKKLKSQKNNPASTPAVSRKKTPVGVHPSQHPPPPRPTTETPARYQRLLHSPLGLRPLTRHPNKRTPPHTAEKKKHRLRKAPHPARRDACTPDQTFFSRARLFQCKHPHLKRAPFPLLPPRILKKKKKHKGRGVIRPNEVWFGRICGSRSSKGEGKDHIKGTVPPRRARQQRRMYALRQYKMY